MLPKAIAGIIFLLTILLLQTAWAQLPKSAVIGTNTPGTVFYALASGIAKVASEAGPVQSTVQPYTGTSTFLPLLNNGELDFGIVNGVDMGMAYQGPQRLKVGGKNEFSHSPNTRLVMRGAPLIIGLLVKKDSPLKSVHDIKGKRVTGEYPAHQAVWFNMFGMMASGGLTWKDVRAEVTAGALNMAKIREADASVGVRHLSLDCSPEGDRRVRQAVPGYYTRIVKAGGAAAIVEDTCTVAYDIYFATHKGASDQLVNAILKATWDNVEKLPPMHPGFKEWTLDRAASADVTLPYHPAAIKFYQEKGVWKKEMDQVQQKLLALNP
jgi:uncharacterized protein